MMFYLYSRAINISLKFQAQKNVCPKNVCPKNFGFNNILCQKKILCQKNLGKGVYPYVFGHSKQLSLNKFFDPRSPSMRKGRDRVKKKNGKKKGKEKRKDRWK